MAKAKRVTDTASRELREFGLAYPGAHLKSPWPGHRDLAVNDKTFAYLTVEGEPFKLSCKLPISSATVVNLPFAKPTAYGLGKAGWVTMEFADEVPIEMLEELIDESYRAVAGPRLRQQLDAQLAPAGRSKKAANARASASKPAARIKQAGARVATAKPKSRTT
jgi:predicted DNA-binding protein (MmcQ/YjbR family)